MDSVRLVAEIGTCCAFEQAGPSTDVRIAVEKRAMKLVDAGMGYHEGWKAVSICVAEPARRLLGPIAPSERQLQCVWYDATHRPSRLWTSDGELVVVEHPGVWNLEAGPDFIGAAVRIGADGRRLSGDVEVHVRPSDWTRHAHARDARYANVRFHVTFHAGPPATLPPGVVSIALGPALAAEPGIAFEAVDVTAYPYAARAAAAPCAKVLAGWTSDARERLLLEAGIERLRRKACRMAQRIGVAGADQALYEEFFAALGYKNNKGPCRRLAQRVPWTTLVEESAGDVARAYALLLGVSGLMPCERGAGDPVRSVWNAWWKLRGRWGARALAASEWRLDGVRPMNRPERRLRAAAVWALRPPSPGAIGAALACRPPPDFVRAALDALKISDPFAGGRHRPCVLGRTRALAILINVYVPFAMAATDRALDEEWIRCLPDEATNGVERRMAHTLFGSDHPPSLRRGPLRRQGLAQIFEDFCLNDRSRCADCPLPGLLGGSEGEQGEYAAAVSPGGMDGEVNDETASPSM